MNKAGLLWTLLLLATASVYSQQLEVTDAFLEKWTNSKTYLMEVAAAMPSEKYDYAPTERQMTFEQQLRHIDANINWIGSSYFDMPSVPLSETLSKQELVNALSNTFDNLAKAVEKLTQEDLKTVKPFFAGPKSNLQLLNLLQDHVTHHRGQLIVYLNLCEVAAPVYSGW